MASLAGCGRPQNDVVEGESGRTQDPRQTHLIAGLREYSLLGDTAYCDSVLNEFLDDSLAVQRPDLIAAACLSLLTGYGYYPVHAVQRLRDLAERADSDRLRGWYEYFLGREKLRAGDLPAAMRWGQIALTRFRTVGDSLGTAQSSRLIGWILSDYLYLPREGLPHLRKYFELSTSIDDRCTGAHLLSEAFLFLGEVDSAKQYLVYLDAHTMEGDRAWPNYPMHRLESAFIGFLIAAQETGASDTSDVKGLREHFHTYTSLLDRYRTRYNWNAVAPCVSFAHVLLRRGKLQEAEAVLSLGQRYAMSCEVCDESKPELLAQFAELYRQKGDLVRAYVYQEERIVAIADNGITTDQLGVESAIEAVGIEQKERSLAIAQARERAVAQAAIERGRLQRIALVVLSVLVLFISALLVNRYRLKRRLQVAQLRASLSRDLHDDIGSTLSSINILSNVARKKAEVAGDTDAAASLDKISDRSQRLMRNMSDIVWSVDPDKDTLEELFNRMREFASSALEGAGIAHTMDFPHDVPAINLAAGSKNNLYLIFKEAINNVVKHAEAKQVVVSIALEGSTLRMEVKDDGRGFDPAVPTNGHGGNGLRNMKARAAELNATLSLEGVGDTGTAFLLSFSLER